MHSPKKIIRGLLLLPAIALLASCNNHETKSENESKKEADTAAATIAPPPPAAPAAPTQVVRISHGLKDYAAWRPFFNSDSAFRKEAGLGDIVVGQEVGKPNNVVMVFNVADVAKAKTFAADPRLKDLMTKAGVITKPEALFMNILRFTPDESSKQWVDITHKVKDFDAWLKVYDAEGKDARAAEGMKDAVLARGIDDPNVVHVVFDITDLDKAKKAINSDAKKKLMKDAGVIGTPEIHFFNVAE